MGLFGLFKKAPKKRYHIPQGINAKTYAQSLLNSIQFHCEEINNSTTVFDFSYSYEKLSALVDEFIWLNEKKHVFMAPSPRFTWSEIQRDMPLTIKAFLDRALRLLPKAGEDRADAIEELLEDITQNEGFWKLFDPGNRARIEELRSEANQIRGSIQDNFNRQATVFSSSFERYGGVDAALLTIDLMEGHEFEHWCAESLKNLGFYDVEVTPPSGDHGVDVLAKKDGIKYAIQCKRYNSDLGNTPVQEVHAGKSMYHCHVGVVITNQHFTSGAKTLAEATDTLLWDRNWIASYLKEHTITTQITADQEPSIATPVFKEECPTNERDEMFPAAVDIVLEAGQVSVAMLQRHLQLGYAQCARLVDQMEEHGIVGPFDGSKPRDILITKQAWQTMRNDDYQ